MVTSETCNGKAAVIIQDGENCQETSEWLTHIETLAAIREGIVSAERGELKDVSQVYAEMKTRYNIQS